MQSWKVSGRGFEWASQAIEGLSSLDSRINSLELISKRKAWLIEACAAENRGGLGASRLRKGTCRLRIAQDGIAMAELAWNLLTSRAVESRASWNCVRRSRINGAYLCYAGQLACCTSGRVADPKKATNGL